MQHGSLLMKASDHYPAIKGIEDCDWKAGGGDPFAQGKAGQVETGQVETGQVETGQVETGQVETGQVETGQVETGQGKICAGSEGWEDWLCDRIYKGILDLVSVSRVKSRLKLDAWADTMKERLLARSV
jgi:hypothetical protein